MAPGTHSRVHGPLGVRDPGRAAADTQREGRPPGPSRPRASTAPERGADFVPPRGPIEEAIAEIWTELLGGEPVGAHDNFFEHGGHSLLAIQLLARLRQTFDVEAPLRDFLEEPTVSRLARHRRAGSGGWDGFSTPRHWCRAERDAPLPASFAQQRLWFLDQLEPGHASYHIPAAVTLEGRLDVPALERALNEVVRRHEVLRTTLVADGGIPRQVIAARLELPLEPAGPERPSRGRARQPTPRIASAKKPSGRSTWRADRSSVPACCD